MQMKTTVRIPLTVKWLSKLMRMGTSGIDENFTETLTINRIDKC